MGCLIFRKEELLERFIYSFGWFICSKSCLRNPKESFSQSVQKPQNSYQEDSLTSETLKENFFSLNPSSSTQLTAKESFYSDEIINIDVDNLPTNVNDDIYDIFLFCTMFIVKIAYIIKRYIVLFSDILQCVLDSIENIPKTPKQVHCINQNKKK